MYAKKTCISQNKTFSEISKEVSNGRVVCKRQKSKLYDDMKLYQIKIIYKLHHSALISTVSCFMTKKSKIQINLHDVNVPILGYSEVYSVNLRLTGLNFQIQLLQIDVAVESECLADTGLRVKDMTHICSCYFKA